jgi:Zn-dependent metalloprotease
MRTSLTVGLVLMLGVAVPTTSAADPAAEPGGAAGPTGVLLDGTPAPRLVEGLSEPAPGATAVAAARTHLSSRPDRYHIDERSLVPLATTGDTVRFGQTHRGIPVLGGQYLVHLRGTGSERVATGAGGRYFQNLTASTTPQVSEETAKERARAFVLGSTGLTASAGLTAPAGQRPAEVTSHGLVVVPRGTGILTYHLTVRTNDPVRRRPVVREVYVDAAAGFPVLDFDRLAHHVGTGETLHGSTVPLNVTRVGDGDYRLRDGIVSTWDASAYDVSQVSGIWPDGLTEVSSPSPHFAGAATTSGAVDAHDKTTKVLDFYRNRLGRNGLDGRGGEVRSLVGVTSFGQPYVNAFWDGTKMVYGGGDDTYYPLSADIDVVGHEMTHGVIEHSANLLYLNQSGALNEAIADYFGNAVDVETSRMPMSHPDAGLLGEDLCRTKRLGECALRDLNDGATMTDDFVGVTTEWDNGGVHANSTIFSGALWDIRERLRPAVADRLVYKALTEYMTPLDDFLDGRDAVLAAARSMRLSVLEQLVVWRAFDAHGIKRGWERRIGVDSTVLLPNITTAATGASAAKGWWTASNSGTDGSAPYAVYAGRVGTVASAPSTPEQTAMRSSSQEQTAMRLSSQEQTAMRLSPEDGRYHVYPHTDGDVVAWAAYGPTNVQIMTRRVDGSEPASVLATIGYPLQHLRVSGDTVAFQINHFTGTDVLLMKAGWSGPEFVDGGSYRYQTYFPDLSGGKVSYLKRWFDQNGDHLVPAVQDLSTRVETLLPEVAGTGVGAPVMTSRYAVWPIDRDGVRTVYRAGLDGTGLRELGRHAELGRLDATETAVTFDRWPEGELTNRNLPKLYQVPIDGGRVSRVSCNRGAQIWFAADTATRVVWYDGTLGRTDLVTRPRPAAHCR